MHSPQVSLAFRSTDAQIDHEHDNIFLTIGLTTKLNACLIVGRTRSTLEANLANCGANSVICGANFNVANSQRGETTVIPLRLVT